MLFLSCQKPFIHEEPEWCEPAELLADTSASTPRPSEIEEAFTFAGNVPEQNEFIWIEPDGRYSYAERFNMGVAQVDSLQLNLGWDWKIGCRVEQCTKRGGIPCCFQICDDGGKSGVPTEPPDQFGCMNRSAGGRYEWFLEGLQKAGVQGLEGCLSPSVPEKPNQTD